MGGSAKGGGTPMQGGGAPQPSQMPANMQSRMDNVQSRFQGQGSAPGQMTGMPNLGEMRPQLQDWRSQLSSHQPGGMDDWQKWMERQRPQYGHGNRNAGNFRGGMGRRAITNPGSFSAAQTNAGGPGEEITAPAAVAGAPNSGQGGNAPASGSPGGGGGAPASQDIIQALRSRFGGQ